MAVLNGWTKDMLVGAAKQVPAAAAVIVVVVLFIQHLETVNTQFNATNQTMQSETVDVIRENTRVLSTLNTLLLHRSGGP